jgi:short-subunit dehydrogenase
MNNETVLITGASSGIGKELAREFAKNGHPIILTATSDGDLAQVAEEFSSEYGVTARFLAQDLLDPQGPQQLFDALNAEGIAIEILVNNAGVGHHGSFVDESVDHDIEMIHLNIEALVRMTKLFLPAMVARGRGRLLNTASIAGFMPAPQMAVYHATKAFVLSFSEALAEEVRKKAGVTVTALCPGATDTDFFPRGHLVDTTAFQKTQVMAPQDVAKGGFDALMRGDRVYVAGGMNKAMVFGRRLLPDSLMVKMTEFFYSDTNPAERKRESGEVAAKANGHS